MAVAPYLSGKAWADLDTQRLADLLDATRQEGWREALNDIEKDAPFFVKRMRNLALGNWHLLLLHDRADRALDVGCGFGSLPLGLAQYYRETVGAEFLPNRIAYASTRAAQDRSHPLSFRASERSSLALHRGLLRARHVERGAGMGRRVRRGEPPGAAVADAEGDSSGARAWWTSRRGHREPVRHGKPAGHSGHPHRRDLAYRAVRDGSPTP